jgi:hypothetical protein
MASVVDICNLALSHFGDSADISAISPPDGSVQAEHCARFYPIARDELLVAHTWGFATTRSAPAELASDVAAWEYSYNLPAGCMKVQRAMRDGDTDEDDEGAIFKREGQRIYAHEEITSLVYTQRITDTTKFVTCLSWLLASYVVGPIRKDSTGQARKELYAMFVQKFREATGVDSNEQHDEPRTDRIPAHIRARS